MKLRNHVRDFLNITRKDVDVNPQWYDEPAEPTIEPTLEEQLERVKEALAMLRDDRPKSRSHVENNISIEECEMIERRQTYSNVQATKEANLALWNKQIATNHANGYVFVWMFDLEVNKDVPVWIRDDYAKITGATLVDLDSFVPDWIYGKAGKLPNLGYHTYANDKGELVNDYVVDPNSDDSHLIDRYQRWTNKTAIWQDSLERIMYDNAEAPTAIELLYLANTINEEAGELSGKVKRLIRDGDGAMELERIESMMKELGDMMYYMAQFSNRLGVRMSEILEINVAKLEARLERDTIRGEGDLR